MSLIRRERSSSLLFFLFPQKKNPFCCSCRIPELPPTWKLVKCEIQKDIQTGMYPVLTVRFENVKEAYINKDSWSG